jgi:hypothetical protein
MRERARQFTMKLNNVPRRTLWGFCLALIAMFGLTVAAMVSSSPPAITSLTVVETNLVFVAEFPPGVQHAALELRPELDAHWQIAAALTVPAAGGVVEFTLPKPELPRAFFRLNVRFSEVTNQTLSAELQFVAVPPLRPDATNADEAVFHFQGVIDGSDRITLNHRGALWEHVNWDWPTGPVVVNDAQWNPSAKNFMTTTGAVSFLPEEFSLPEARLEVIAGRDAVALERTNGALIIYLDDTPVGAERYEFKLHFPKPSRPKPAEASPAATLKIQAWIDGSDVLKITANEAVWTHRAWDLPVGVRLNDIVWDVGLTNTLANAGTNQFLPDKVDLSTARITNRQGRDVATMRADHETVWVTFADNPNGGDDYELEISFGP